MARRPRRIHRPAHLRRGGLGGEAGGHVNVTPMIDVVMCLIVFYLIVGRLASQQLAAVDLPVTGVGEEQEQESALVVNVSEETGGEGDAGELRVRIVVEGREVAGPPGLEALVRQRLLEAPATVVQIRGGRRLPYGAVEPVLHACARAGAGMVQLMAERAEGARGGGG